MVVAYPAGRQHGPSSGRLLADRIARLFGGSLGGDRGQPLRRGRHRRGGPGRKSAPDGHTLLLAASPEIAIARSTQRDLPYDPVRDFAAIGLLAQSPFLLLANAGLARPTCGASSRWRRPAPAR
jgi:hypothetical protein